MKKNFKIIVTDCKTNESYNVTIKAENLNKAHSEVRHWIINHCDLTHEFDITFDLTGEDVGL